MHKRDCVAQSAADRDDAFCDNWVTFVRHSRGSNFAFLERLVDFVDLIMGEADDFTSDLGKAAAHEPKHAHLFD